VELTLAANIVGNGLGDLLQRVCVLGVEDLSSPVDSQSVTCFNWIIL
jgi:hypothetical protein